MTIKNEVSDLEGVTKVDINRDSRQVTVEWTEPPASWDKIKSLLEQINYPPTNN
jgi:copper chaperone CopZ